jgi:hypothetical protein
MGRIPLWSVLSPYQEPAIKWSVITPTRGKEIIAGKTGGSRRKFKDDKNNIISLHKPHPSNTKKDILSLT